MKGKESKKKGEKKARKEGQEGEAWEERKEKGGGGGEGKFPRLKVKQPTTAPEKVKGKKDKNKKETGETHYTAKVERPTYEGKLRKNFTLYNGK